MMSSQAVSDVPDKKTKAKKRVSKGSLLEKENGPSQRGKTTEESNLQGEGTTNIKNTPDSHHTEKDKKGYHDKLKRYSF